jgi:hypothetical protein
VRKMAGGSGERGAKGKLRGVGTEARREQEELRRGAHQQETGDVELKGHLVRELARETGEVGGRESPNAGGVGGDARTQREMSGRGRHDAG